LAEEASGTSSHLCRSHLAKAAPHQGINKALLE
jgi:hypothetical protein